MDLQYLDFLPIEIWYHIFFYIHSPQLAKVMSTCKYFHNIIEGIKKERIREYRLLPLNDPSKYSNLNIPWVGPILDEMIYMGIDNYILYEYVSKGINSPGLFQFIINTKYGNRPSYPKEHMEGVLSSFILHGNKEMVDQVLKFVQYKDATFREYVRNKLILNCLRHCQNEMFLHIVTNHMAGRPYERIDMPYEESLEVDKKFVSDNLREIRIPMIPFLINKGFIPPLCNGRL